MPNEGSYGGKIEVRMDGSVVWQVAEREFAKDRDTDGTLEYAIRVANSDRNSFTSRDGKCVIVVDVDESSLNVQDKAKFLIVSGYETPDTPYESIVVGKSYFVIYGKYVPRLAVASALSSSVSTGLDAAQEFVSETPWDGQPDDHDLPAFSYDLSLRYDDYDLERSGLPADLDPDRLEVCYQNFVSLRDVYRVHFRNASELMSTIRRRQEVTQTEKADVVDAFFMTGDSLQSTLIWNKTYQHLEKLGIKRSLIDDIGELLRSAAQGQGERHHGAGDAGRKPAPDVLFSRWLPVIETVANDKQEAEKTAKKSKAAEKVKASPGPLEITADDLAATPGKPVITVKNILSVPGSRTITLRGLNQPGTFILMYHGDVEHYERRERDH